MRLHLNKHSLFIEFIAAVEDSHQARETLLDPQVGSPAAEKVECKEEREGERGERMERGGGCNQCRRRGPRRQRHRQGQGWAWPQTRGRGLLR